MSQTEKAAYYKALKEAGVKFDRHYREYSTDELQAAYGHLMAEQGAEQAEYLDEDLPAAQPSPEPLRAPLPATPVVETSRRPQAPVRVGPKDPNEMAGQRQNTQDDNVPIRVDDMGREWYQEEVLKPSYPKPRGRRVLEYTETGTKKVTTKNGDYLETFEVAGDDPGRPAQVKITLPSYQVGTYRDPRLPFKIHSYNENTGFDLFEVQDYYGGAELVPAEVKRKYVENVLCYDIRTVIRAIESEYRRLQLQGKVD